MLRGYRRISCAVVIALAGFFYTPSTANAELQQGNPATSNPTIYKQKHLQEIGEVAQARRQTRRSLRQVRVLRSLDARCKRGNKRACNQFNRVAKRYPAALQKMRASNRTRPGISRPQPNRQRANRSLRQVRVLRSLDTRCKRGNKRACTQFNRVAKRYPAALQKFRASKPGIRRPQANRQRPNRSLRQVRVLRSLDTRCKRGNKRSCNQFNRVAKRYPAALQKFRSAQVSKPPRQNIPTGAPGITGKRPSGKLVEPVNISAFGKTRSPGRERVGNAIDNNTRSKFLNFNKTGSGFTVTFGKAVVVNEIEFTTANDDHGRDPTEVEISGSNKSPQSGFSKIADVRLTKVRKRFAPYGNGFTNGTAYKYYRVVITDVDNKSRANSFQFAEVDFYSTGTPPAAPAAAQVAAQQAAAKAKAEARAKAEAEARAKAEAEARAKAEAEEQAAAKVAAQRAMREIREKQQRALREAMQKQRTAGQAAAKAAQRAAKAAMAQASRSGAPRTPPPPKPPTAAAPPAAPPMAAAAEEVCLPNERITKMKDTAKHNDYMYSVDKCASQPQGGCEAGWGNNRCAMSSAVGTVNTEAAPPAAPPMAAAEEVCLPNEQITKKYYTANHNYYMYVVDNCASLLRQGGSQACSGSNTCAMSNAVAPGMPPAAGGTPPTAAAPPTMAAPPAAPLTAAADSWVCVPSEKLENMRKTGMSGKIPFSESKYQEWVDKCKVSGEKGMCGWTDELCGGRDMPMFCDSCRRTAITDAPADSAAGVWASQQQNMEEMCSKKKDANSSECVEWRKSNPGRGIPSGCVKDMSDHGKVFCVSPKAGTAKERGLREFCGDPREPFRENRQDLMHARERTSAVDYGGRHTKDWPDVCSGYVNECIKHNKCWERSRNLDDCVNETAPEDMKSCRNQTNKDIPCRCAGL